MNAGAADPDGDAAEKPQRKRRRRRRTSKLNRPVALILQAGAIAAAIASISGLVIGVVHALHGNDEHRHRAPGPRPAQVLVSIPPGAVHETTFVDWMRTQGVRAKDVPRDMRRDIGVTVEYGLKSPGYKRGTSIPLRFLLFRRRAGRPETFVGRYRDTKEADLNSETGTVKSYVPVPRGSGTYRIEVQVFRPNVRSKSPFMTVSSTPFHIAY